MIRCLMQHREDLMHLHIESLNKILMEYSHISSRVLLIFLLNFFKLLCNWIKRNVLILILVVHWSNLQDTVESGLVYNVTLCICHKGLYRRSLIKQVIPSLRVDTAARLIVLTPCCTYWDRVPLCSSCLTAIVVR